MRVNDRVIIKEGKKVFLVVPEKKDIEVWYEGINNIMINKFLSAGEEIWTKEKEEDFYNYVTKNGKIIILGIMDKESGKVVGTISFYNISHFHKTAKIAIVIFDTNFHNKGLGSDSMRLMLDYGFKIQGFRKVSLDYIDFNKNGEHVYLKLGFKHIGVKKIEIYAEGDYRDEVLMEIFKDDFYELNKEFLV